MYDYKEQLLNFMLTTTFGTPGIKLSHYDYKFMANLQHFILTKNEVTTNQASLFDALISKYRKQLDKNNLDHILLKSLPWECDVVESLPKFTQARVGYDQIDCLLTIELPYKKDFINSFKLTYDHNPWEWSRTKRRYETKVSTYALMIAQIALPKFFPVTYHDEVKEILDEIVKLQNETKHWNPTYIKIGDKYIIVAINDILEQQTKDLVLDNSPVTLYKLSKLGIDIDESVHCNDPKLVFCSEFQTSYVINNPSMDIDRLFNWIKEISGSIIHISVPRNVRDSEVQRAIMEASAKYSMPLVVPSYTPADTDTSSMQIRFSGNKTDAIDSSSITKMIYIINQKEINIE